MIPPRVAVGDATITVFVGRMLGVESPATVFSPLVGAELLIPAHARLSVPVDPAFEHGILLDRGTLTINGERAETNDLVYVGTGRDALELVAGDETVRAVLLGGTPFDEQLVMWWNFIARSHDEIVMLRDTWQHDVIDGARDDGRFGRVVFDGPAIPAPDMPKVRLRPRGARDVIV